MHSGPKLWCFAAMIAMVLVLASCSPTDPDPNTTCPVPTCPQCGPIAVLKPDSTTLWRGAHFPDTVSWSGAQGDSVKLTLFRDGKAIDFFPAWVPNRSPYVTSEILANSWEGGSRYKIQVLDRFGNFGWSQEFEVQPDPLAVMMVTGWASGTEWRHRETTVDLVYSLSAQNPPDSIRAELYYGRDFVALYSGWTKATAVIPKREVPVLWGTGNDYRIRIVDKEGRFGWSSPFAISAEAGNVIRVRSPNSQSRWVHSQENVVVEWDKGLGDSVSLSLFRNGSPVGDLTGSIPNSGSYTIRKAVSRDHALDSTYQVQVKTSSGLYGFSAPFSIVSDSFETIKVRSPETQERWQLGTLGGTVRWSGAVGDSFRVFLYMSDTLVGLWSDWSTDTFAVRDTAMPRTWPSGNACRMKVVDNVGYYGWSGRFVLTRDTSASITVLMPDSSTVLLPGKPYQVSWQGAEGDMVRGEMFRGDTSAGYLFDWVYGDSSFEAESLDERWGPGTYRLRITDTNNNHGWSAPFTVLRDTLRAFSLTPLNPFYYVGQLGSGVVVKDARGDSIRVLLYRNGSRVGLFADWSTHDTITRVTEIPSTWGSGLGFYFRAEAKDGRYGESASFRIGKDSLQRLDIVQPLSGESWSLSDGEWLVRWATTAEVDSLDTARIDLYRNNSYVGELGKIELGTIYQFFREDPLPREWGTGTGFRVKVTLLGSGLYGWSDSILIRQ